MSKRITRTTPSEPYRFTSARFEGALVMLDASGASWELWASPPSYLAPNGLGLNWAAAVAPRSVGIKSASGGVAVPVAHPKKNFYTIKAFQRTVERRNSFRQAKRVPTGTLLRRANGLCGMLFPHASAIKRHACQLLFSPVFSFWQRKNGNVPSLAKEKRDDSPVGRQKQNALPCKGKNFLQNFCLSTKS